MPAPHEGCAGAAAATVAACDARGAGSAEHATGRSDAADLGDVAGQRPAQGFARRHVLAGGCGAPGIGTAVTPEKMGGLHVHRARLAAVRDEGIVGPGRGQNVRPCRGCPARCSGHAGSCWSRAFRCCRRLSPPQSPGPAGKRACAPRASACQINDRKFPAEKKCCRLRGSTSSNRCDAHSQGRPARHPTHLTVGTTQNAVQTACTD